MASLQRRYSLADLLTFAQILLILYIVIHSLKIADTGEQGDKDHELSKKTPISVGEQNGGTQASRNVSCVADTNSQREVVVECFAPYEFKVATTFIQGIVLSCFDLKMDGGNFRITWHKVFKIMSLK